MKINKIYISAFGGLKDFTLELSDGLNVIYGENENGKSTVAAFIKAMFYGTGKKTQQLSTSIRQKYTPWDGESMGGRIYFEHAGKQYCLERQFRKSDSTDRILLTDMDTGVATETTESIGQRFFGISAAAFERSMFIGSTGGFLKDDAAQSELSSRLSNIALTGDEDVSYQRIAKRLESARNKVISKSGRAGSFAEDAQKLSALEARLERADEDAKRKAEINANIAEFKAQLSAIQARYIELKGIIESESDLRNREKLEEFIKTQKALDAVNDTLKLKDGSILGKPFAAAVNFGITKYDKISERCDQLKQDIEKLEAAIKLQSETSPEQIKAELELLNDKLNKLISEKEDIVSKELALETDLQNAKSQRDAAEGKKTAANPVLLLLSIISAVLIAAGYMWLGNTAAIVMTAITALLLALSFVIKPKNQAKLIKIDKTIAEKAAAVADIKGEKAALQEKANEISAQITSLTSLLNTDIAVKAQRQADLQEKSTALSAEQEKMTAALNEVLQYFGRYQDANSIEEINEALAGLQEKTEKQGELKLKLSYLKQDLGDISCEEAQQRLSMAADTAAPNNTDFETLKAEFEAVSQKIASLREGITAGTTELKTAFKASENPEDIRREIKLCRERLISKKAFCDAADTAISVLEESSNELCRSYGSEVEELTLSIFKQLTDGAYQGLNVSKSLDMSVEPTNIFGTRDIEYLSQGTTDQAYLSLRLAISKLISKEESLPVILDDSLSQYDDKRTKIAIKFLKDYCNTTQALLFTCHNSICEAAENLGVEIKKPYNK